VSWRSRSDVADPDARVEFLEEIGRREPPPPRPSSEKSDWATALYIRDMVAAGRAGELPDLACGAAQRARFLAYKGAAWRGGTLEQWRTVCLAYADLLNPDGRARP
jgi:hypothetical protein